MNTTQLKSALIGVGNIAAFIDSPESSNIASHTKAFLHCKKTQLVSLFEPNAKNIAKFKQRWNIKVSIYNSLDDLLQREIDILAITSPTKTHFEILQKALYSKASYILCEKPLVSSLEELQQIEKQLLASDKKILINIIREYNPIYQEVYKKIQSNLYGKPVAFHAVCTKGLLHNGIHHLSLLEQLLGEIIAIHSTNTQHASDDLIGDFTIKTDLCNGTLNILKDVTYSTFTLTLWFENGKIELLKNGDLIYCHKALPSEEYEGYSFLEQECSYIQVLNHYALDSLEFLLTKDKKTLDTILRKHLQLHRKIFLTLQKGYYETSN